MRDASRKLVPSTFPAVAVRPALLFALSPVALLAPGLLPGSLSAQDRTTAADSTTWEAAVPDTATRRLATESGRIEGFGSVPWGSGRAAVMSAWGVPDTIRSVPDLASDALIYADRSIAGEKGMAGFLVHPERGLIRGMYMLPYGEGSDCRRLYDRVRAAMDAAIERPPVAETVRNGAGDLDFCTAFQLGQAEARAAWADSVSGSRAWLRLDRVAGVLRVSYESPLFEELGESLEREATERFFGGGDEGESTGSGETEGAADTTSSDPPGGARDSTPPDAAGRDPDGVRRRRPPPGPPLPRRS